MSFDALAWAGKCRAGSAARKLVLLALADRHNTEEGVARPSVAWIAEWTDLNRKTVINALADLESAELISDSGIRAGKTGQVKAYRLHLETVPKTEQSQKRNSSTFSEKQSQKRDTDTIKEPVPSEAKASSGRRGCRLEEEWVPDEADIAFAKGLKFTAQQISVMADTYRDYWRAQPGQRGVKTDWPATWRNWCRREAQRPPPRKQYVSKSGYQYNGDRDSVKRQAEKRRDTDTYWTICGEERAEREAQSIGSLVGNIVGKAA